MLGVFDVGRVLNAKTAANQLIGGMVWGIAYALSEEAVVDPRSAISSTRTSANITSR